MNWKRATIASLFAVPLIILFAWGFTQDPNDIPSPLPGRMAPDFRLPVFAPGEAPTTLPVGDTVHLASLRGEVVVLNFWASWCLSCRDEHRELSAFARRYAGKPVHFLGVLYNDFPTPAINWIQEMGGQQYPVGQRRHLRTPPSTTGCTACPRPISSTGRDGWRTSRRDR